MGKVLSIINIPRFVKTRYNIESRAQKFLSKEKPTAAPKYASTIRELDRIAKEHPEFIEEQVKRDEVLDYRLRQVYVNSHDPQISPQTQSTPASHDSKPLPQCRTTDDETEFGYVEPALVPPGKVTLKQALEFISSHQTQPDKFTAESIAEQYKLDKDSTEKILTYFRTLELYQAPPPVEGAKPEKVARGWTSKLIK